MLNQRKLFVNAFVAFFAAPMLPLLQTIQPGAVKKVQVALENDGYPDVDQTTLTPSNLDYKISVGAGKTSIPINLTAYTENREGISSAAFMYAITNAAYEWDLATSANLIGSIVEKPSGTPSLMYDGENAIFFADLNSTTIALASYWYDKATKEIIECDIQFKTDFEWGDATTGQAVTDLQNIAAHELGHFFNLADIYDETKTDLTMYGKSWVGDVEKRTLAAGDITGINKVFATTP